MTVDELGEYGMQRMDDKEIEKFLMTQSLGILGLPTEGAPYLLPMSYGFDGGSRLYFFYIVGNQSRKEELSTRTEAASFLVYSAETAFHWRSVLLLGTIRKLPEGKRADLKENQTPTWRPELFEGVSEIEETDFWVFQIEESTGIRHAMRPPSYPYFQRSSENY